MDKAGVSGATGRKINGLGVFEGELRTFHEILVVS